MTLYGYVPLGNMYCTFTTSYCTKLGHTLDDEQFVTDVVKAIKKKDDSIVTSNEKELLEMVKKVKHEVGRSGKKAVGYRFFDRIGQFFKRHFESVRELFRGWRKLSYYENLSFDYLLKIKCAIKSFCVIYQ